MSLRRAIETGDLPLLKTLVNKNNVNILHKSGLSLLHYAVSNNQIDCLKFLIGIGANVNILNRDWLIPLNNAVHYGYVECIKLLLVAGAYPDTPDYRICEGSRKMTPLTNSIGRDDVEVIKILIDYGASINKINRTYVKEIPKWIYEYIENRLKYRRATLALIALHKRKQDCLWFVKQDKHVIKMIGKHIWSMRMLEQ
jgi:ankyrin repeat protein